MNFKKTVLAFGLAAAAFSISACSDDSSSSGPDSPNNTAGSENGKYLPITEGSTESAQKLYNFLKTNFGTHTVSGVQTGQVDAGLDFKNLEDVQAVFKAAGKYPALVGFDFLFATGSNANDAWYQEYTQSVLEYAAQLWKAGGIPAFSWHWKDPSDAIDAFYTKKGNDKEFTTFDYSQGFIAGTTTWDDASPVYQQIIADIDEISAYFKQLQDQGVAAIFRPLHEAGGAWFWWSATTKLHSGEEYAALYRLVYDRMVKVNGIKNLVWVWNTEKSIFNDASWNPGDEYYDVFSVDIYNKSFDYQSNADVFNTMAALHPEKLIALSENGPIPDASLMHKDNAVWSWNMPWYETWDGKYVSKTQNNVWAANLADPCVYALEDMPGWDKYVMADAPAPACNVGYSIENLDTSVEITVNDPADIATNGYLKVVASAAAADTAKGNIVLKSGAIDLSAAKNVTLKVDNSNNDDGVWFTIAFLGNADTDWAWAQPEGCWVNGGEVTTCTIDLSTTAQDETVLEGDAYTTFMKNISKVYLEFFGAALSSTIFFDAVQTDAGEVINDFDQAQKITIEQGSKIEATVVGNGN